MHRYTITTPFCARNDVRNVLAFIRTMVKSVVLFNFEITIPYIGFTTFITGMNREQIYGAAGIAVKKEMFKFSIAKNIYMCYNNYAKQIIS